jgi:hypothetical protein
MRARVSVSIRRKKLETGKSKTLQNYKLTDVLYTVYCIPRIARSWRWNHSI